MSYKGTLRSLNAAIKRADRAQKQHQRELERQQKQARKLEEIAQVSYEVEVFNNRLEVLLSVHKDCGEKWDWQKIKTSSSPEHPKILTINEEKSKINLENYQPSFFDKLFKKVEKKQENLVEEIELAKELDSEINLGNEEQYKEEMNEWRKSVGLATRILEGETEAYKKAVLEINPLSELEDIGFTIKLEFKTKSLIEVYLIANSENIVPSELLSQLKSGKLSKKPMPKSRFYEIYQDHICGAVLRVARELYALLPVDMMFITTASNILNEQTGHLEEKPILSTAIPRESLISLNFDLIDPSESMKNFVHNMKFLKTKGFSVVEKVILKEV